MLAPGEGKDVSLTIPKERFLSVNEQGGRVMAGHRYTLYLGLSQPDARSTALMGQKPEETEVRWENGGFCKKS